MTIGRHPGPSIGSRTLRCNHLQGAMRPDVVVLEAPVIDHDLGLEAVVEQLQVQQLLAHPAVVGLDVGILPWRPGSMNSVLASRLSHQRARAWEMSSGPLSQRT